MQLKISEIFAKEIKRITVHPLKSNTRREVKNNLLNHFKQGGASGGLPIDVGVIVQNIATAFAIYEAVRKNKPLVERVVTVTGNGLTDPSN